MSETLNTPIQPDVSTSSVAAPQNPDNIAPIPRWRHRLGQTWEHALGAGVLIPALAILATVPVLNLLSLGYLLAASGRIAQSGRLRDGFIGLPKAAVVGRIVGFGWLFLLPLRFIASMWDSATLIDPEGPSQTLWLVLLCIGLAFYAGHMSWAILRGARIRDFLWPAPIKFFRWLRQNDRPSVRDRLWDFVMGLHLPKFFWLGARGFAGSVLWLIVPVGILIIAAHLPEGWGALLSVIGGLGLLIVACQLPFLQTHFAAENRWAALFEWRQVRAQFRRAPIAFLLALLLTLALALPLYLLKIELPPQRVAWLPSVLFVIFAFPARLISGWAVGRARRHENDRTGWVRWGCRLSAIPVAAAYVLAVYMTQYLSWYGSFSLLEQHAFLVPAPALQF